MKNRTKAKRIVSINRKAAVWALVLSLMLALCPARVQAAEDGTELNIYAIYLNSDIKGDSVLLESKGEYLLIDMGRTEHSAAVLEQLKLLGVTRLNVMFSHLHVDHTGGTNTNPAGGLKKLADAGIRVNTLYLPTPSLTMSSVNYPNIYSGLQTYMKDIEDGRIEYLNVGSELHVGDARGVVLGPVDTSQLSPSQYQNLKVSDRYIRYENNCSLVTMFYCGNTKYFTAGDIYTDQADLLVKRYGNFLRADIMKLSHHGTGGNTAELMDAIRPSYSFALNTSYTQINEKTGRWQAYASMHRAAKYGMCYMVANEEQTLIYHIENDVITMYQGKTIASGYKLTGWQTLCGGDGNWRNHELHYFDEDGQPVKGVQTIDGHDYYFPAGGRMEYGRFDTEGNYSGWMTYEDGRRYFTLSEDEEYAYVTRGFVRMEEVFYCFRPDGRLVTSEIEDSKQFVEINEEVYCVDPLGDLSCQEWIDKDGKWYYFGKDGTMKQNKVCQVDGEYYIFTEDGSIATAKKKLELYKFGSSTYALSRSGYLVRNQCRTIDGAKYYMNDKGAIQKNKLFMINGNFYYFGKDGKMVLNKTVKIDGKKYFCNKKGVVSYISG